MTKRTIVFLSLTGTNLYLFRLPVIQALTKKGLNVIALVPDGPDVEPLRQAGVNVHTYVLDRKSLNPFKELVTVFRLISTIRQLRPDVLHSFTVKPNIYGTISAWCCRVPVRIATITGLGSYFIDESTFSKVIRSVIGIGYWIVGRLATTVLFQNDDDASYFISKGWARANRVAVIKGSGIDTTKWVPREKSTAISQVRFLMVARFLVHKGVNEFIDMAGALKRQFSDQVECVLVGGPCSGNRFGADLDRIDSAVAQGDIVCHGWTDTIQQMMGDADVFVLPSYREGVPRSGIEALSMGLPIITTDAPGCKDIVDPGQNGFRVPVGDTAELISAATQMIQNPDLRYQFSKESRSKALAQYDVKKIVSAYLALYERSCL